MNKKIIVGLLFVSCICFAAAFAQEKKQEKKSDQDHVQINGSTLRWEHSSSEDGTTITLAVKNAQFNDDYTDVERIASDGYFRLSETRAGIVQRLEITPEADGQLKRVYSVRGDVRPFDGAARKWLARLLEDSVAGSGFDAEARVGRILRKGGANAVLTEITRLKTDYARRVYSSVLIEQGNLTGEQLSKLLSQSARTMGSDYEKATLLIQVLKNDLKDAGVRAAFFEMVGTLGSDYERGRVLAVLLKRSDLTAEMLLAALKSVRGMGSDYEKANVLIRASKTEAANESVRASIIEAAHALGSDYERGRVLTAVTKKQ
ncbi:MAG TPA: hypothetical protein VGO96_11360 [Pyrinomonadaceae bacterium]|jgi:hypothetical protein|nr:hypothetical protein [Pyrinomonadaceae bacterium]